MGETIARVYIMAATDTAPTRIRVVDMHRELSLVTMFDHASDTPEEDAVRELYPLATKVEFTNATKLHSYYRVTEEPCDA